MKPILLYIAVFALTLSCSPKKQEAKNSGADPEVKTELNNFLESYFSLNQALIDDNLVDAKLAASAFSETTNKFDASKLSGKQLDTYYLHSSNLKLALGNLGAATDIEYARVELATISEAMYALVKEFHPNTTPLYYQYCPMARDHKGATWISAKKELENPYMGQMMLACGRTQETIN